MSQRSTPDHFSSSASIGQNTPESTSNGDLRARLDMEDTLIAAQLCCQEAENAMVQSNFFAVAEKFQAAAAHFQAASSISSSTANRLQLEGFSQYFSRKAQEAEDYINQKGDAFFEYGNLGTSEDSDSEETSSGTIGASDSSLPIRRQTPSLDVAPTKRRSDTLAKPPSLEEYQYAAQLEKRMSTSPLQALALGFQTVRDLVLGTKPSTLVPSPVPSVSTKPSSLGDSFFMIADPTIEVSEREKRLQDELCRVQVEFTKIQLLLDKVMQEQQQVIAPARKPHNSSSSMLSTAIAREAHLKQSLRENYLSGSETHPPTDLEAEIKRLREQLTAAERRNSEWALKWDQVKQKAIRKRGSSATSASLVIPRSSLGDSMDPNLPNQRLQASTPHVQQ